MDRRDLPTQAKTFSSYVVYRLKSEYESFRLKARIVPHGNRDALKDEFRKDSASEDIFTTRLVTSIIVSLRFKLAVADIKRAYMKSGPIKRETYVRPPTKLCKD